MCFTEEFPHTEQLITVPKRNTMPACSTKLSSSITVDRYLALEQAEHKGALGKFIKERFEERYFKPIEDSPSKHGFTILAVACLVIETLESFYQGRADTHHISKKMFNDFFERDTPLKVFGGASNWFFNDIRCGILHQGEVRNGWRIWRKGPLLDTNEKTINATLFLREIKRAVATYGDQLTFDDECWRQFKKKMKAVRENCENA